MSKTRDPAAPDGPSIENIADRTLDVVGRRELPRETRRETDDPSSLLHNALSIRTISSDDLFDLIFSRILIIHGLGRF